MKRPKVYTLCGSSRFPEAFHLVNAHLSMQGHVVISLGLFGHADEPRGARFLTSDGDESTPEKTALDQLHFRKIDLSDAIFVVNVGGYVGSSTKREIAYAEANGKQVEWLFTPRQQEPPPMNPTNDAPAPAPSGSGVRVKPLEWVKDGSVWVAHGAFGQGYQIYTHSEGDAHRVMFSWSTKLWDLQAPTLDEAKAAAQADYEARILSAIASE